MNMITPFALYLAVVAATASAAADPAATCRAAHADDPPAHIACLESALREPCGANTPAGTATDQPVGLGAEQVLQKARIETATPTETVTDQPTGLGADQVLQKARIETDEPAEQATFLIVSATYNSRNLGVFRLDNGQVWRETEESPSHKRLKPDQQYQVRIERAKIGKYRMYVEGVRWMFKIERLK